MNNRISLPSIDDTTPDRETYVGWDRGLGTYFAQVFDGVDRDGEDIVTLDLGNEPGELSSPDQAIDAVRPYAQIPEDLDSTLVEQRDAPGAMERSRFADYVRESQPQAPEPPMWQGFER